MLKRFLTLFKPQPDNLAHTPIRLTHHEHQLDIGLISKNAITVIRSLQSAGFLAYLVGGGVRDLLLDGTPKDFDVATSATPEQIKQRFNRAMIIGRRFRIVHVRFGREIIEVTTFRAHHDNARTAKEAAQSESGLLLRDNVYGDLESDALRRDFTINALYFDPIDEEVLDFSTGIEDLSKRNIRIIGDAEARYREDPVRMLRAVRFAAKLGFNIDEATAKPIQGLAVLMADVPTARRFEEVLKLLLNGCATATTELLIHYQLFQYLFPGTAECLEHASDQERKLVSQATVNTDKRIRQNKRVTPAFIYAVFLWLPLQAALRQLKQDSPKTPPAQALQIAGQGVISQQLSATAIPKRFLIPMREIWQLQSRLEKRDSKRALSLMEHPRFRAAYDFLLLREESGEPLDGLGLWWTRFQEANEDERQSLLQKAEDAQPKRRRRPRRRKPRRQDTPPTE